MNIQLEKREHQNEDLELKITKNRKSEFVIRNENNEKNTMEGTIWKRLGKKISMSEVHLKESSIVRVVSFFESKMQRGLKTDFTKRTCINGNHIIDGLVEKQSLR